MAVGVTVQVGVAAGVEVTVEVRVGVREMEPPQAAVRAEPSIRTRTASRDC